MPLTVLPVGGLHEAFLGIVRTAVELFKPELGVHHFVLGHLLKGVGDLVVAVGPCGLGEIGVFVAGHGFPGQGLAEIFRCFAVFQVHKNVLL